MNEKNLSSTERLINDSMVYENIIVSSVLGDEVYTIKKCDVMLLKSALRYPLVNNYFSWVDSSKVLIYLNLMNVVMIKFGSDKE